MAHIWGLQSFGHGQGIAEYDMPPRRGLPPNAKIAVRAHMEPVLLKGGETVKPLSTAFLADFEEDWRHHGKKICPIPREKYAQAYFQGIMTGGMSILQAPLIALARQKRSSANWKSGHGNSTAINAEHNIYAGHKDRVNERGCALAGAAPPAAGPALGIFYFEDEDGHQRDP
jgi:hypothetical protein